MINNLKNKIMILTDRTKADFEHFIYTNYDNCQIKPEEEIYWQHFSNELTLFDIYEKLPNVIKNALIIEFFDSVGIILHTSYDIVDKKWGYEIFNSFLYKKEEDNFNIPMIHNVFKTRQEAIKQAIIKANEIYNNKKGID